MFSPLKMHIQTNTGHWISLLSLQPLVKFKSHLYYEEKDHVAETEKSLKPLMGSQVKQ